MKKKKSTLLIVGMSFLLSIGTLMFSSCADKDDPSPILPTCLLYTSDAADD